MIWASILLFVDVFQVYDSLKNIFGEQNEALDYTDIVLSLARITIDVLIIDYSKRMITNSPSSRVGQDVPSGLN